MEEKKAGVMIPIPQYPLYSAAITELNAHAVRERERVGGEDKLGMEAEINVSIDKLLS